MLTSKQNLLDNSQPGSSTEGKPVFLPINACVRIFSFLKRDDLDCCQRVCKLWGELITNHNQKLPKRNIECLVLTTDHEFRITTIYKDRVKEYASKKYFGELDIDGFEFNKAKKLAHPFNTIRDFKFPCGDKLKINFKDNYSFPAWDSFHYNYCLNSQSLVYKRGRNYGKKLFTPPLAFYEKLAFLLKNCYVKHVIFQKFTFTELFVEKFLEYLNDGISTELLYMHNVKFRYISPPEFHRFLNEAVRAKIYAFEHLRYALFNHINSELMRMPTIQRAQSIYVGHCGSRVGGLLTLNVSPQAFLEIATYSKGDDLSERHFFGVANSRITDDNKVLIEFGKIYRKKYKKSYYRLVVVGGQRCIDGVTPNQVSNVPAAALPAFQAQPAMWYNDER